MVDIDRSGQMVSAARHLGVCGKAVVPTRLNDRCDLVPPQVCHEEDDDDDEEEGEEGLNSISWDITFQRALYNNKRESRMGSQCFVPGAMFKSTF